MPCLKSCAGLDNPSFIQYNIWAIGVWRSLVSRLVRVQEASGSNPDTPTKIPVTTNVVTGIFFMAEFEKPALVRIPEQETARWTEKIRQDLEPL